VDLQRVVDLQALDDRALVAETQGGNRDAFSALVVRYQERVLNLAFRRLGDQERALDVAQEVFFKAYRGLDRFQGQSRFYTWLFRITLNEAISARRKGARHAGHRSLEREDADGERLPDPPDESFEPHAALESRDDQAAVQRAIAELEDDFAQPLVLRDIEGLSYQEVAEVLQIPLGSVKSRIHRARQTLKERLAEVIEKP